MMHKLRSLLTVLGLVFGVVPWDRYLANLLPEGTSGVYCVLKNTCKWSFAFHPLHSHPRFKALLKKIGLTPYADTLTYDFN